jgi:hypothetical protein
MGKAEAGTPKAIGKQLKAKGLQKLKCASPSARSSSHSRGQSRRCRARALGAHPPIPFLSLSLFRWVEVGVYSERG